MLYYSTGHKSPKVSLEETILNGIAPDGGVYMPEQIVRLPEEFVAQIENFSLHQIAFEVCRSFFEAVIPPDVLKKIISEALNFDVPLIQLWAMSASRSTRRCLQSQSVEYAWQRLIRQSFWMSSSLLWANRFLYQLLCRR